MSEANAKLSDKDWVHVQQYGHRAYLMYDISEGDYRIFAGGKMIGRVLLDEPIASEVEN